MLIQSQDGDVLVQTVAVLIYYEKERNIYLYYLYACNSEGKFDVGIFDTEFQAQTVLKDVQKYLESSEANFIYQIPYRI